MPFPAGVSVQAYSQYPEESRAKLRFGLPSQKLVAGPAASLGFVVFFAAAAFGDAVPVERAVNFSARAGARNATRVLFVVRLFYWIGHAFYALRVAGALPRW